ncbi:hypothetical protein IU449_17830 [Nocardia higoensis]|uniref:Uncharacterized protein n=1 Tax=Nocardia higoensis TaxID=228599 RepID=A0ABS0DD66_9NOCA|nr:hypothetical protein [Nocardia higoensis]MBF6356381.1 hypothetical protein [Nocardia higoensis]
MRTTVRLAVATLAGATLISATAGTTGIAAAEPPALTSVGTLEPAPSTGSATIDGGSTGLYSGSTGLATGNIVYALLGVGSIPLLMLFGAICDMSTLSAADNPCVSQRTPVNGR